MLDKGLVFSQHYKLRNPFSSRIQETDSAFNLFQQASNVTCVKYHFIRHKAVTNQVTLLKAHPFSENESHFHFLKNMSHCL